MSFFDRYARLCQEMGIDPCGQKVESLIGINKTTANKWNVNGTTPKGETVRKLADFFHVSADYLLERTDDRTDYANRASEAPSPSSDFLKAFSSLSSEDQKEILSFIEFKAERRKAD